VLGSDRIPRHAEVSSPSSLAGSDSRLAHNTRPALDADLHGTDEALALASGRGDAKAFHALYARHRAGVVAYVTKLVGAGPDREDVIQDVFLQLHRALPSFRADASLSTFLRRITMNVAFDHLRRRSRRPCFDYDSEAVNALPDTGQDPEQRSSARQQLQSLIRYLDGIAVDERWALLLVSVAGLSLHDAAVRMGANTGWVKQRVVRARRELTAATGRARPSRHRGAAVTRAFSGPPAR